MRQYNKTKGIKGIVRIYNDTLRFRDIITKKTEERVRILAFWQKHGEAATKEAFRVSRPTLFRWQKELRDGGGKLEALNPKSTAPINRRKRVIPENVERIIINERSWERIGKEKIVKLLKEDGIADLSDSIVGRMIDDLKKRGKLPDPMRYSLNGRTGRMIEKKPRKHKQKLRSKGHEGALVKADTVVRFKDGIKRYILTGIDLETKFAFAYGYPSHTSSYAASFIKDFKEVALISLTYIQTDNESEFQYHFEIYLKSENITHFHTYPRSPKMNAVVERFNRTLNEDFIKQNKHLLAYDVDQFNQKLTDWLIWYNTERPHYSLEQKTPIQYTLQTLPPRNCHMWWTHTKI